MFDLESRTESFEYVLSDYFVLFKATRHMPKILSEKDSVIKYYKLFLNALITGMQIGMYSSFYDVFFK
ncbi:MAG: hypothetical protein AABX79_03340 [Nanoarchaeota archaeon]